MVPWYDFPQEQPKSDEQSGIETVCACKNGATPCKNLRAAINAHVPHYPAPNSWSSSLLQEDE
eukprot:1442039-Amphidinium_carterae.1